MTSRILILDGLAIIAPLPFGVLPPGFVRTIDGAMRSSNSSISSRMDSLNIRSSLFDIPVIQPGLV